VGESLGEARVKLGDSKKAYASRAESVNRGLWVVRLAEQDNGEHDPPIATLHVVVKATKASKPFRG
jgi:hypothetical protein